MPRLAPAIVIACLAAACSGREEQTADPAELKQLLASLERRSDTGLSPAAETRLRKADRLAGTISRVEPKRIDPNLAVALIAR
jgi:hypothetical protein